MSVFQQHMQILQEKQLMILIANICLNSYNHVIVFNLFYVSCSMFGFQCCLHIRSALDMYCLESFAILS
jgi:hypothetical protein